MRKGNGWIVALLIVCVCILIALLLNLWQGGVWIFQGLDGLDGTDGENGKSAYELAVEDGYSGTLHEWLVSLAVQGAEGEKGETGRGIADVRVDESGNLMITLSDGSSVNAGYVGNGGFASEVVDAQGFTEVYETVIMNHEASQLNLRQEPSVQSAILATISAGDEVLRIGYNKATGWTRLIHNGVVCYANAKYFDLKYNYEGELPQMHLPKEMILTVGKQTWFMADAILSDAGGDFALTFSYSGAGVRIYDGNTAFAITPAWQTDPTATPHAAEQAALTVRLEIYDEGEWRLLEERSVAITVVEARNDLTLTGIVIGDSRISDGTIVTKLQKDLPNLTLLGTRATANEGVCHEGRGAWSAANYLKSASVTIGGTPVPNAFYNPTAGQFDFSYYMKQNYPTAALDFVVINLGANDGFTQTSVEYINTLVASVRAYATEQRRAIKILVMTEYLSPATGFFLSQESNLDISAMRDKQFRYYTYLEKAFGDRRAEGIYLLPNYLCINDWSDRYRSKVETANGVQEAITDVIHLGWNGYQKEADVIENYLFGLFGNGGT
ncbi:MAG: hypothetical protein IJX28_00910 [Clostridia bacterium]|nr:hypothetical protein [Clostridia bacterium]